MSESIGIRGSNLNGVYPSCTVIEAAAVTSVWQSIESQTVSDNEPGSSSVTVSPV
ncbi:MAG: Uncharacterised protein [Chloroflexota bacterium]|nr:MAG: Uncharacterised protein [Chloroflexota bacterium]